MTKNRNERRKVRHNRVRSRIEGTSERPRLSVYKSNTAVYAQIIDDTKGVTIVSSDSRKVEGKTLSDKAKIVGQEIAKLSKENKIDTVVFDRGGYTFTGVVKNLAEGAREGGLKF